ncbi:MAG: hypothetical protein GY809_18090 [Planctomycetes bacterium]|nr:hypothetical protein [Planctomycetota bacterium]
MGTTRKSISLIGQIGPAVDHTKAILFAPFNLKRWLAIGFCAWLASLGEGRGPNPFSETNNEITNRTQDTLNSNPGLFGAVLIFGIAFAVTMTWLSSRGRFMFYHCALYNSDKVAHPWHYYQHLAASLFKFRLVLVMIGTVLVIVFIGHIISTAGSAFQISDLPDLLPESAYLMPLLLVIVGLLICDMLTTDFVIPVMHKHTLTCTAAWSYLWLTLGTNKSNLFLYLLFKALVAMTVGFVLLFLGMITRGVIYQMLLIPYVGTLLLLPVFTFKRVLALHYLRQFGPEFDAFVSEPVPSEDQSEPTVDDDSI